MKTKRQPTFFVYEQRLPKVKVGIEPTTQQDLYMTNIACIAEIQGDHINTTEQALAAAKTEFPFLGSRIMVAPKRFGSVQPIKR